MKLSRNLPSTPFCLRARSSCRTSLTLVREADQPRFYMLQQAHLDAQNTFINTLVRAFAGQGPRTGQWIELVPGWVARFPCWPCVPGCFPSQLLDPNLPAREAQLHLSSHLFRLLFILRLPGCSMYPVFRAAAFPAI